MAVNTTDGTSKGRRRCRSAVSNLLLPRTVSNLLLPRTWYMEGLAIPRTGSSKPGLSGSSDDGTQAVASSAYRRSPLAHPARRESLGAGRTTNVISL